MKTRQFYVQVELRSNSLGDLLVCLFLVLKEAVKFDVRCECCCSGQMKQVMWGQKALLF